MKFGTPEELTRELEKRVEAETDLYAYALIFPNGPFRKTRFLQPIQKLRAFYDKSKTRLDRFNNYESLKFKVYNKAGDKLLKKEIKFYNNSHYKLSLFDNATEAYLAYKKDIKKVESEFSKHIKKLEREIEQTKELEKKIKAEGNSFAIANKIA